MASGRQLIGLIICATSVAAADVTFTDDFNDEFLDPMSWTPTTGTGLVVLEENGYLRVGNGSFTLDAYARTVNAFIGDFDVQVDFEALLFPFIYAGFAELRAHLLDPGPVNSVVIGRRREFTTDNYVFRKRVDGAETEIATTGDLGHETGKFRLTRVGTKFTAYYWDGGWQTMGSTTHFAGPVVIDLLTRNAGNHPIVRIAYDNFQITADDMTTDCNGNLIDDVIDHADCDSSAWCDDCNNNDILDGCDLDWELSSDSNTNGIPDECDVRACCLPDGSCVLVDPQVCVASNGLPLEFGAVCLGDNNGDGVDDACPDPAAIPTVSQWGLMILTLLLLTAATIMFGRQRRVRAVRT